MIRLPLSVLVSTCLCATGWAQTALPEATQPRLTDRLARDPVAAWHADSLHPGEIWDSVLSMVRRFVPESELVELEQELESIDDTLGLSLRDDLLALLGPRIGMSVDLPPIDTVAGLAMASPADGLELATSRIGLVAQVRERERLNRSLHQLFTLAGAEMRQEADLMAVSFAVDPNQPELVLKAFYGFRGDYIAVGFSPDWIREALSGRASGRRLTDGDDYNHVRQLLDPDAELVAYVNLPRLQQILRSSQMVQGGLAADPEAARAAAVLLDPEFAKTGAGLSSIRVGSGVRRTTYGPAWLSGATQMGIIAAIAIPNLQSAIERARQKRTVADLTTLATALEAYAVDNGEYPSTDGEWVDVESITDLVSPVYLREPPTADGWRQPIRIKSDRSGYVLVSPGRDGELSRDWTGVGEPRQAESADSDLVYADGRLITVLPAEEPQ